MWGDAGCGLTLADNTGSATASTVTKPFLGVRFQVLTQSVNVTRFDAALTSYAPSSSPSLMRKMALFAAQLAFSSSAAPALLFDQRGITTDGRITTT
jgi:hypothetical protein